tara:strand:+ start:135 stop:545 length:411 start_codon:yes stop_codon:yes gene_type:complete
VDGGFKKYEEELHGYVVNFFTNWQRDYRRFAAEIGSIEIGPMVRPSRDGNTINDANIISPMYTTDGSSKLICDLDAAARPLHADRNFLVATTIKHGEIRLSLRCNYPDLRFAFRGHEHQLSLFTYLTDRYPQRLII